MLWPAAAASLVLILLGVGAGWMIGRFESLMPVRMVVWWLTHVIVPRLRSSSWWLRMRTIFLNNSLVLAGVLTAGFDAILAVGAVLGLGLSLGIGLRILAAGEDDTALLGQPPTERASAAVTFGVALNLLEPPAILLTAGMCLLRSWIPLLSSTVWISFVRWTLPLLLVAACGEALWLGAFRREPRCTGVGGGGEQP